ncbi:zinc finger protein 64-like isoform X1 [Ornithodoros turicata]|uniref:zinc finger protein 64-like isoform X1 n=1 Tax=Ornithodoros turicata TaxID=34597 RepID=UPI003138A81A
MMYLVPNTTFFVTSAATAAPAPSNPALLAPPNTSVLCSARCRPAPTAGDTKARFPCSFCPYSCASESMLIRHLRTHTGEKPFRCRYCPYASTREHSLTLHERRHTGVCLEGSPSDDANLLPSPGSSYEREFGPSSTAHKQYVARRWKMYSGEKRYKCRFCSYTTARSDHLKSHQRTHTGEKPYKCRFCNYAGAQRITLVQHERRHTGDKPYKCSLCNFAAPSNKGLKYHERTHQRDNRVY